MVNEAILQYETELPIPFVCDESTGIEKGALLELADLMIVTTANGDADICAGIAAEEKIAGDGKTSIPVFMGGIFLMKCEGAVPVGEAIQSGVATGAAANVIMACAAGTNGLRALGHALETGADGELIRVRIQIGAASEGT